MIRTTSAAVLAACMLVSLSVRGSHADLLPAGPEFSVISEAGFHGWPAVDHFADGSVVVAWIKSDGQCCGESPMVGRIYASDGTAAGPEFALGTLSHNGFQPLRVRVVPPGDRFVVVRDFGDPVAPMWRLYDSAGVPLGPEVTVPVAGDVESYGVAVDANGNLAILYREEVPPDTESWQFKIQRYTMAGVAVGSPTVVDSSTSREFLALGLEPDSEGHLVVAWVHYDGEAPTGFVRRYDASGAAVGSDFIFDGPYLGGHLNGKLATDGAGHIYVASRRVVETSVLKRFNLDGSGATQYSFADSVYQTIQSMSGLPDGRLVVSWSGSVVDYQPSNGWLTTFAADGTESDSIPLGDNLNGIRIPNTISTSSAGSVFVGFTKQDLWSYSWIDAEVQRVCDSGDAGCLVCPAFDDGIDSDGDLIPDGCDPCSNVGGAQDATRSSAAVSFFHDFYGVNRTTLHNKAVFSQSFVLPDGVDFASLGVATDGMRLRIESKRGQRMFDATLPGGAYGGSGTRGWSASTGKLNYVDRTGSPIEGTKRVSILDRNGSEPGLVRIKVRAGRGAYGVRSTFVPMKTIISLGDESASDAGVCGEFLFTADECETGSKGLVQNWGRCSGSAD